MFLQNGGPTPAGSGQKQPKTVGKVFNQFGTNTSFQGIPFIIRGTRWYAKAIWTFIFVAASAACIYHCYSIFDEYYKRKVTSKFDIGYDTLPFPSVTVCNINPVRLSRVSLGGAALEDFVASLQPQEGYDLPNATKPDLDFADNSITAPQLDISGADQEVM